MAPRLRTAAAPLALALYVAALFGATALLQDGLFERDGYYHARLARLLPERGFSRDFPWTQVSTWRQAYCDKEVLYHLAMAPFTLVAEPIGGARVFALLLSVGVVALLTWLLRRHAVPWPTYFAALPLATGGLFLARLGMIRSHVLSMSLLLLGLHLLLERRWRALAVLGFVYAWSYTVPFVLVLTAAPLVVGRALAKGGLDWKSVLAAGLGAVAGLTVHPYSPLTLETFLTITQILRTGFAGTQASGFELGNELYPYPPAVFFDIYPLLVLATLALLPAAALLRRRLSPDTWGLLLATAAWSALTARAPRFVEYQALLLAVSWGLVVRDAVGSGLRWPALDLRPRLRVLALVLAWVGLAGFHARALSFYVSYQRDAAPPRFFDGAARWMEANLAVGETVINLYWDDFPDLFYSAPRQRYLWGLDPIFSVRADLGLATWLERARRHQLPLDAQLAQAFSSRWLVLRAHRAQTYPELKHAPFTEVYRDALAVVYRID